MISELNGAMAGWVGRWIPNTRVWGSKPLDGSKADSSFHPSKVDQMSIRNSWELSQRPFVCFVWISIILFSKVKVLSAFHKLRARLRPYYCFCPLVLATCYNWELLIARPHTPLFFKKVRSSLTIAILIFHHSSPESLQP